MAATDCTRSRAFRTLVTRLQSHHQLKGVVKVWKAWEGRPDDEAPPASNLLPFVRLTPVTMPASRHAAWPGVPRRAAWASPLKVLIETVVPGSNWDAAAALWERFEAALWPQDPAERAAWEAKLSGVGIRDVRLIQPALPTGLDNLSTEMTVSDGAIQLDLQILL